MLLAGVPGARPPGGGSPEALAVHRGSEREREEKIVAVGRSRCRGPRDDRRDRGDLREGYFRAQKSARAGRDGEIGLRTDSFLEN